MEKADRFYKIVDREFLKDSRVTLPIAEVRYRCVKLLLSEHAAVVRMVKNKAKYYDTLCDSKDCKHKIKAETCRFLVSDLARRGR